MGAERHLSRREGLPAPISVPHPDRSEVRWGISSHLPRIEASGDATRTPAPAAMVRKSFSTRLTRTGARCISWTSARSSGDPPSGDVADEVRLFSESPTGRDGNLGEHAQYSPDLAENSLTHREFPVKVRIPVGWKPPGEHTSRVTPRRRQHEAAKSNSRRLSRAFRPEVERAEPRRLLSALSEFPIPGGPDIGAKTGIAAGPDGAMWFVSSTDDRIGRLARDGQFYFRRPARKPPPETTRPPSRSDPTATSGSSEPARSAT